MSLIIMSEEINSIHVMILLKKLSKPRRLMMMMKMCTGPVNEEGLSAMKLCPPWNILILNGQTNLQSLPLDTLRRTQAVTLISTI